MVQYVYLAQKSDIRVYPCSCTNRDRLGFMGRLKIFLGQCQIRKLLIGYWSEHNFTTGYAPLKLRKQINLIKQRFLLNVLKAIFSTF